MTALRAQGVCQHCREEAEGEFVAEVGGNSGAGTTLVTCDPCSRSGERRAAFRWQRTTSSEEPRRYSV